MLRSAPLDDLGVNSARVSIARSNLRAVMGLSGIYYSSHASDTSMTPPYCLGMPFTFALAMA
jgi:hypothetical protein